MSNQRFRFNYILGNGPIAQGSDFDLEDEDPKEEAEFFETEDCEKIDLFGPQISFSLK